MTGRAFRRICWAGSASRTSRPAPASQDHMGLGIFIAQSLLERTGAHLTFDNLAEGGAHVVISWNRANLETAPRLQPSAAAGPRAATERQSA